MTIRYASRKRPLNATGPPAINFSNWAAESFHRSACHEDRTFQRCQSYCSAVSILVNLVHTATVGTVPNNIVVLQYSL